MAHSQVGQTSVPFYFNEYRAPLEIAGAALILTLSLLIFYKKGVLKGEQAAKSFFNSKLDELSQNHKLLARSLDKSRLTPDGYAQVALTEGISHHHIENGYVLRIQRILEHRAVAQETLGRGLAPNEVVHHIYAPATDDNSLGNLCVLDRDQHDLFHTFLERKYRQEGHYPRVQEQKRLLRDLYSGILIEEAAKNKRVAYPPIPPTSSKTSLE